MSKNLIAIGMMSGTSIDGIDVAIIETDGITVNAIGESVSLQYDSVIRNKIRNAIDAATNIEEVEDEITRLHGEAVEQLLLKSGLTSDDIDIIGFHGQTVKHDPDAGVTVQLGDGRLLSDLTGIDVVNDFRSNDIKCGGQGAPLVPIYHQAIAKNASPPIAIVNIGGVGNITWIGEGEDNLVSFDTGPGNALIDDWVLSHKNIPFDDGGKIASAGVVSEEILAKLMDNPYFRKAPPKSLDRNEFANDMVSALSVEDGAATLAAFTIKSIAKSAEHFPDVPKHWYITGGGRHNSYIMSGLSGAISSPVSKIEELGYDGDMLEAEAFGFLAVRSKYGLPLTFPSTTGASKPATGGILHEGEN